ncbi:MAG: MBL fold metallo-hydrolase [Desulfuromonadaceae bacterium]|nr:MBL fold metallo-hydrolase [Desulfuromonadaceae bacterium]
MRVIELSRAPSVYTCRSYLILGDWNVLGDVNTLIDPGTDGSVIDQIETLSTGCGKVPVEQVILTHNHFDHAAGVEIFKLRYGARVYAWCDGKDVDELLCDGHIIKAGDDQLQVMHTPGHSSDSICLYNHTHRILFSGDTQLRVRTAGGVFVPEYIETLRRLSTLRIDTVYSGHDEPINHDAEGIILETLRNVRNRTLQSP